MKKTTNTTQNETTGEQVVAPALADLKMNQDLKHSILIFSLIANLFIFTAWIAMQVTTQYDMQVASFLFSR